MNEWDCCFELVFYKDMMRIYEYMKYMMNIIHCDRPRLPD